MYDYLILFKKCIQCFMIGKSRVKLYNFWAEGVNLIQSSDANVLVFISCDI